MLILQQLFNLSDEELEFQPNDRRSFEEFVGLGVMDQIPDSTTISFLPRETSKSEGYQGRALYGKAIGQPLGGLTNHPAQISPSCSCSPGNS